jgi:signal transduction histidine kinase
MPDRADPALRSPEPVAPLVYRIGRLAGFFAFLFVAIRKLSFLAGRHAFTPGGVILGLSLLLYVIEPLLVRRSRAIRFTYYLLQGVFITALGLLRPYEDTWGLLYIPLGMSLWYENQRRSAAAWTGLYAFSLAVTMLLTFGGLAGLGFTLTYLSASAICISYAFQVAEAEIAQAKSQKLLRELQEAHAQLKVYAGRVEELAAIQERDRLARTLHDSVSQMIFSISLNAQAAHLMLEKDPARLPELLDRLQGLTGEALARMRALISQWRPG